MPIDAVKSRLVRDPTPGMRYFAAVWSTALAMLLSYFLSHLMQQNLFVLFAGAVMFTSWYGGLFPGLLATVLATVVMNYMFLTEPYWLDFTSYDLPQLGLFIVVAVSISWLNERRRSAEGQLRQSEEHFRSLVEGVQDYAIFMLDPRGAVVSWNPAAERISGYTADSVLGKPFSCFFPPEDVAAGKPARLLELATARGRAEEEDWRVRRDGSRYWAGMIVTPLHDDQKKVRGFSTVTRDLTERRRAEDEARQHQAELARMSRLTTMNELATGIAHELNQPLSAITIYSQGCLEQAAGNPAVPADLVNALRQVTTQAERAAAIIEHFRKHIRKREPMRAYAEMHTLVREALNLLHADIHRNKVSLILDLAHGLPKVHCDDVEIEQAMVNLIKNAIEAMQSQPLPRELTIHTGIDDEARVYVTVSDTGPGLTAADHEAVFEPFYTTKTEGLGMGLAISRTLIEGHGGSLRASNSNGKRGATFRITLPMVGATEVITLRS